MKPRPTPTAAVLGIDAVSGSIRMKYQQGQKQKNIYTMKELKSKNLLLLSIIIIATINSLLAQDKIIKIWNGNVPNSIINSNIHQAIDSADNWIKMKNITAPTLEMFLPEKENANGTAVVICPGGAYYALAIVHEGKQIAQWLNSLGITAFVLNYRLPNDAIMKDKTIGPLQDAQAAIRLVRLHAKEWNINSNKIGIMGFSAGGHLAASLSTHFNEKVYQTIDTTNARPNFSLLIYPVITMDSATTNYWSRNNLLGKNPSENVVKYFSNELQVSSNTPPAFLVYSIDDDAVPVINSINYALALHQLNIPCELHIYQKGGHGYGLGKSNNSESSWRYACEKWLEDNGFKNKTMK